MNEMMGEQEREKVREREKERKSELDKRDISHVFRKHTFILSHTYSCRQYRTAHKIFCFPAKGIYLGLQLK